MSCCLVQYNTIQLKVKNAFASAVTLQSVMGKNGKQIKSLVINVQRHCDDVTSDGRLFQVLATATCNAWQK